jgi:WD40 repeat protein
MSFDIFSAAVEFVNHTTNRIVSAFLSETLIKENKIKLPATLQKVRQDQRLIQAEMEYYQRREARRQEFLQLQESLNQTENHTDTEITLVSDHQEKLLQLQREEIADRYKLSTIYLDLSHENTVKQLVIKQQEIQGMFDQQKWPGILSRDEAQRIFVDEQKKPRLLMLVPPPDISDDFPVSFRDSLKKEIRNQLKLFLEKYYPISGDFCPVEFYGKYFERSIFDAEVKQLETILSSVPTAIIYTDITDHEVYFNVKFWGLQEPVSLSFEPWNWEQFKEQLEEDGNDETKSLRAIRQTIVILHKLLAAFLADWYYLNINPNYEPQLLKLSEDFPSVWTEGMLEKLKVIIQRYRAAYNQELKILASVQREKPLKWYCLNTLYGHSGYVFAIAVNPTGNTFASASADKMVKIWDIETGEPIHNLTGHSNFVCSVAYSPDGKIIATGSYDKTFKLWHSLKSKTFIEHYGCVTALAFSQNGEFFATASMDKTIKIWDAKQEKLISSLTNHKNYINSIAFTKNGQKLISCDADKIIKIWNIPRGNEILTISEHSDVINTVTISPDDQIFATGSHDHTIKLWYIPTGELIHTFKGHTDAVTSVAFSPDGKILASGSNDNTIKLWYLYSKELITTLTEHSSTVHSVAFSIDGNKIISGSADNTIKIWQTE